MITENGIVTQVDPSTVWVKTIRASACKACSSKDNCHTANSQKTLIVMVKNTLCVEKGDHVVIGLQTQPMLILTFLLYVFPIILLIIGAVIGNGIAPSMQMDPSLLSMLTGFSFFGLAFYFIRKKNDSLSKNDAYKPFLVRKKSQVIPSACSIP